MKHLLILFHSQSGRAQALALSCFFGAQMEEQTETRLLRAIDASIDDLLWADGLLLVTPENFAAIAGGMKEFLDRIFYPAERAGCCGLPYALVVSAGNDGSSTVRQLNKILSGLSAKQIQEELIIYGKPDKNEFQRCQELGLSIAAGLALGVF